LGMNIAASIPTSPQVANATNAGEPIIVSLPKHAVSAAILALATKAAGDAVHETASADVSTTAGSRSAPKRGLLRRNGR
jgi:MinD-like ATPase involved in chromosome partitioning or flagellar assembly